MAFTAARTSMLRGRPPGFPSGIIESTNAHCASVKSVAYVLIPVSKNLERSLRIRLVTARTFQTASYVQAEAGSHRYNVSTDTPKLCATCLISSRSIFSVRDDCRALGIIGPPLVCCDNARFRNASVALCTRERNG